jgi:putative protease
MDEHEVGKVTHYYSHIGVAVVKLTDSLSKGDKIKIAGHTTNLEQTVDSMQIEHNELEKAKKGQEIGLKVADKVREHDTIFKV